VRAGGFPHHIGATTPASRAESLSFNL